VNYKNDKIIMSEKSVQKLVGAEHALQQQQDF